MVTSSSTSSSSNIAAAFALAIAIVVLVHVGVERAPALWRYAFEHTLPLRDDAFRVHATIKLLPGDSGGARVFLMGSSQTREDFDVAYLNERFEGRASFFNLGFSGNGNPIEMYMLLPEVLQQKPDLIVYMPFIGSLYFPYSYATFDLYFNPDIIPVINDVYGWHELVLQAGVIRRGMLGYASVLFRHRRMVEYLITDSVQRFIHYRRAPPFLPFAYYQRKPPAHYQQMIQAHASRPRFHEHPYRRLYEESFERMVARLEEAKVPLLVIDGPVHPLISKVYDTSLDEHYQRFFSRHAREAGFMHLGAGDLPDFPDHEFTDFTHLHASGRLSFNGFFGNFLESDASPIVIPGRAR